MQFSHRLLGAAEDDEYVSIQRPKSMPETLLNYLREHSERVITRQELASDVWKLRLDVRSRVIDQTISQARKRLAPDERIFTVHGIGYQYRRIKTHSPCNNHSTTGK